MDDHLIVLAREYIEIVDQIRNGAYDDFQTADSQRMLLHDDLCRLTRLDRSEDMYRHCKNILHDARAQGRI